MTLLFTLIFALLGNLVADTPVEINNPGISINDGSYAISADNSTLAWKAYKVGGQHNGEVKLAKGTLDFENDQLKGGTIVVDMQSIEVLDLEGEWKQKLEGHLKSPDFFGVENHSKATFVIKEAFPIGTTGEYRVKGDLTIKDITNPISFNAQLEDKGDFVLANADIKIDRAKYDVRYGSGSFFDNLGDKTIYDEFDLAIALQVKK